MKIIGKKLLIFIVTMSLLSTMSLLMVGCNNSDGKYKVTFDLNYSGSTAIEVMVDKDTKVTKPTDPTRDGYIFEGWYSKADGSGSAVDFENIITENTTVYAKWQNADNYYTVTYNFNCTNAPNNEVVSVGKNTATTAYDASEIAGPSFEKHSCATYGFLGWFTQASGGNEFDFSKNITENITLYAQWGKINYTLEAEYTNLDNLEGLGGSTEYQGVEMIGDGRYADYKASNGFYVRGLYDSTSKTTLTFNFTSDKEVTNARLDARWSFEFRDYVTLTSDEYQVEVNGVKLSYETISLTGLDGSGEGVNAFNDYLISNNVNIKQGNNVIKLIVNNVNNDITGFYAKAPMVDCLKIYTDANLEWNPKTSNLSNFED